MIIALLASANSGGIALEPLLQQQPRAASAASTTAAGAVAAWAEGAGASYQRVADEHFVPLAAAQMAVVRGAADLVGQHSMHATLDPSHAAVMAVVGLGMSGCGGALWLRHLERALGPSDGPTKVLTKATADLLCWGPIVNSANLVLVPLLLVRRRASGLLAALLALLPESDHPRGATGGFA